MSLRLTVIGTATPPEGHTFEFDRDEVSVGRDAGNEVCLPYRGISKRHVRIVRDHKEYFVLVERTTNGTQLNGAWLAPLQRHLFRQGDVLTLGEATITVAVSDSAAPETPPERTAELALRMVRDLLGGGAPAASSDGDGRAASTQGPQLIVLNGPQEGRRFGVRQDARDMLIGRSVGCDITLDDKDTSREHARLRHDERGLVVVDLGSKNGVDVNQERVKGERRLHDRDEVRIGSVRLVLLDPVDRYLSDLDKADAAPAPDNAPSPAPDLASASPSDPPADVAAATPVISPPDEPAASLISPPAPAAEVASNLETARAAEGNAMLWAAIIGGLLLIAATVALLVVFFL